MEVYSRLWKDGDRRTVLVFVDESAGGATRPTERRVIFSDQCENRSATHS